MHSAAVNVSTNVSEVKIFGNDLQILNACPDFFVYLLYQLHRDDNKSPIMIMDLAVHLLVLSIF